jgi:acetyltransferase-like isoleucine patch superfamily enzyme
VVVMPGVKISRNAIVYPYSVVTKNVGVNEVVGGNPAKFIKLRNENIVWTINNRIHFSK